MQRWSRALRRAAMPALVMTLSSCAIVDDFSGRAVDFNMQAEQAQEQALLLNVVRASLRRPMQFTGLQSITGTASISGGSTLSIPFGEATHRPKGAVSPDIAGFSGTISGGPTFIVPVLDTQEFYQGILAPISLQVFDYYLQQGLPAEVLFDLFVAKIVITQGTGINCREITYNNSVNDDVEFDQFQAVLDMLLAAGLSTEHVEAVTAVGAPIPAAILSPKSGNRDGSQAAALVQAYSAAASAGYKLRRGTGAQADTYHLEKSQASYRFCFADPGSDSGKPLAGVDAALYCNHARERASGSESEAREPSQSGCAGLAVQTNRNPPAAASQTEAGQPDSGGNVRFNLKFNVNQAVLDAVDQRMNAAALSNPDTAVYAQTTAARDLMQGAISFKLQVRSTEGILYYLGEITRRNLYPESTVDAKPRVIQIPTRVPHGAIPKTSCDASEGAGKPVRKSDLIYLTGETGKAAPSAYFCENLFVVDAPGSDAFISVRYDGRSYGLAGDRERTGRTYQVLELVKQILALNTSAKQLPATSVLVISNPQ